MTDTLSNTRPVPVAATIRRLFLEPEHTYTLDAAAALLQMKVEEIQGWIDVGEIEPADRAGLLLPWSEVVALAVELWEQDVVEAALGDDLPAAIPDLRRLTDLHVRVPQFEVVGLEHLAARQGTTVAAIVDGQLLDLMSSHFDWLRAVVPGFAEAIHWPDV